MVSSVGNIRAFVTPKFLNSSKFSQFHAKNHQLTPLLKKFLALNLQYGNEVDIRYESFRKVHPLSCLISSITSDHDKERFHFTRSLFSTIN